MTMPLLDSQVRARSDAYQAQIDATNRAAQAEQAVKVQDPRRSPRAAMNNILDIADTNYAHAANNPVDAMLMAELSKRVTGQNVPYDSTTINALKTGAAEQSAAAEQANSAQAAQSLESRGFTPNDPSFQAAMSANQTARQQSNQAANLSIAQNANLANYNAQGQAISQANTVNRGQTAAQLQAGQFATQGYNQVSTADMAGAPGRSNPALMTTQQGQAPQPGVPQAPKAQPWQQLPTWQNYNKPAMAKPATQTY
jgi:hypothetical protein